MSDHSQELVQPPQMEIDSPDFDIFTYIQTKYKNSSDIDLADALVYFNKSITKKEHESKLLVTKHFDRFIECKTVLETIRRHIEDHSEICNLSIYDANTLKTIEVPEFDDIKRKDEIQKQFSYIFDLKQNLKNCISPEDFVSQNKKAYQQKISCNSQYLNKIWDETSDSRMSFLDNMYSEILKGDRKFEDVMQYFEFYFDIDEMLSKNDVNRKEKLENTILLHIKCKFNDSFAESLFIALDLAKSTFFKVMGCKMSNNFKKGVIKVFSENMLLALRTKMYDFFTYKLILRECNEITEIIGDNTIISLKYNFITFLNNIKSEIIENIMFNLNIKMDIDSWCATLIENINKCKKIRKELVNNKLKTKLTEVIDERLGAKNSLEEMEYTRTSFLENLARTLNVDVNEFYNIRKNIEEVENKVMNKATRDLQEKMCNLFSKGKDRYNGEYVVPKAMMLIFELIRAHPTTCTKILENVKDDIHSSVCKHFLSEMVDFGKIEYTDKDQALIDKYSPMFGFLIDKSNDKESNDERSELTTNENKEKKSSNDDNDTDKYTQINEDKN